MAKDVTYIESHELLELATKLKDRYYLFLGHIDLELIYFAEMIGDKPKKAKVISLSGISNPWVKAILAKDGKNHKLYCLSAWGNEWSQLGPSSKQWAVFKLLCNVEPAMDGKLKKYDIQDHGFIQEYMSLAHIGPYWEKSDTLPDMLADDPLPIPPPPLEEEDESDSTL